MSAEAVVAASTTDGEPREALRYAADGLRAALGNAAILLDIARIAIGGSVGLNPVFFQELIAEPCHPILDVEIVQASLGADAGLVGAADLALRGLGS